MDKIDNLIILIDKYTELIKPIIEKNKSIDRKKDLELFVKVAFLERFYFNSCAIKTLLELFKNDQNYKFPIGLLLRTGISDFLTYFYIVLIVKDNYPNSDLINCNIRKFFSGNIRFLKKEIDLSLSKKKITIEQRDKVWLNIRQLYDDFFDPKTGKLIDNGDLRIADIKKKLEKNQDMKWVTSAYEHYTIFSKYEHVGALTYDLQKFHLQNVVFDQNGIIMSIIYIYWGVEVIVKSMNEYQDLKVFFDRLSAFLRCNFKVQSNLGSNDKNG